MQKVAVLLASVSLVTALLATAASATATTSLTIRVFVVPVTRTVRDVPPKTLKLGEETKGDTLRGTSVLKHAVPQFGKPKGARVGTSSFVITVLSPQTARDDATAKFPGGTVHAHGVGSIGGNPKVPIIGGTGLYAGATGVLEARVLANGDQLDTIRLKVP